MGIATHAPSGISNDVRDRFVGAGNGSYVLTVWVVYVGKTLEELMELYVYEPVLRLN